MFLKLISQNVPSNAHGLRVCLRNIVADLMHNFLSEIIG